MVENKCCNSASTLIYYSMLAMGPTRNEEVRMRRTAKRKAERQAWIDKRYVELYRTLHQAMGQSNELGAEVASVELLGVESDIENLMDKVAELSRKHGVALDVATAI